MKKVLSTALFLVLSAAPAQAATNVTVTIDPGNPYSEVSHPETEGVVVTLRNEVGEVVASQATVAGTTTFVQVEDGLYDVAFPDESGLVSTRLRLPQENPDDGSLYDEIVITPKFVPDEPTVGDGAKPVKHSMPPGEGSPVPDGKPGHKGESSAEGKSESNGKSGSAEKPSTSSSPPDKAGATQANPPGSPPSSRLGGLASTGASVLWVVAIGMALILGGLWLMAVRRREREEEQ